MERFVYYSIGIFLFFIFFLYIYLLYEKITGILNLNRKASYEKFIIPYIDGILANIDEQYPENLYEIRELVQNSIKRDIVENRIIYYIEMFTGNMRNNLIRLSEEIGLVSYQIKNLKNKDSFKTALALKKLGSLRSRTAIEPIMEIVNKRVSDIRYHALMALSKIGDNEAFIKAFENINSGYILSERSLTEIIDSFEGDKFTMYERMISSNRVHFSTIFIKSAGNYMSTTLNDEIARFIHDEDKDRRIAAVKALGQVGDIRFLDKLIECLYDDEWEVRAVSAKALGRFEDNRPIPHLTKALSDKEWWVRYNAALSIIKLPGGVNVAEEVLAGSDRFAKDILISAIQGSGILEDVTVYDGTADGEKRRLAGLLQNYADLKQG